MVMYDNELKEREIKFKPRIKLNHNIDIKISQKKDSALVCFFLYLSPAGHAISRQIVRHA